MKATSKLKMTLEMKTTSGMKPILQNGHNLKNADDNKNENEKRNYMIYNMIYDMINDIIYEMIYDMIYYIIYDMVYDIQGVSKKCINRILAYFHGFIVLLFRLYR